MQSHSRFAKRPVAPVNSNPQQFHLWATSNSIAYTFNCDPRATDELMFKTAGGMLFDGNNGITNLPTEGWEHK